MFERKFPLWELQLRSNNMAHYFPVHILGKPSDGKILAKKSASSTNPVFNVH
jgi:hypothetical protein